MNTPGQAAKALVAIAQEEINKGDIELTRQKLEEAIALRSRVEEYDGSQWQQNHHDYTEAMLDMAVLYYKLGDLVEGDKLASRAQAWADDPNCSSQKNFERSLAIRKDKEKYYRSGVGQTQSAPTSNTIQ